MIKPIQLSSMLGMLLFTAACVTINVYFPSAAAEQAADQIIRGVYGEESNPPAATSPEPESSLQFDSAEPLIIGLLDWLVSPVQAAAANINIQSPAVKALRASMESRFSQLKHFYQNGGIGMTNGGLIKVRDLNAVHLRERKTVKTLVTDENRDRNAMYAEIARANGRPEWEADIRKTFAERWITNAPAGWWYQNTAGQWAQK